MHKIIPATAIAIGVFFVWAQAQPRLMAGSGVPLEMASKIKAQVSLNTKTVALNDLARSINQAADGAVLYLAAGDYKLVSLVKVQKSISLIGAGQSKTRVISSGKTALISFLKADLHLKGISFVHLGKQESDVLDIEDSKVEIEDCGFSGGYTAKSPAKIGDGIWLHGRSSGKISTSKFENNTKDGLEVQDNSILELERDELNHNGSGLTVFKNAKVRVMNSVFQFNKDKGIEVINKASAQIEGNEISLNKFSGISFFGTSTGSVLNNKIYSDQYGIEILDSSTVSVSKNSFGSQKEAIYVAKKAKATIGENTFENNGQDIRYEK